MIVDEIDLHGYTVKEAMEIFILFYEEQLKAGKKPFNVIHGYGSHGTGGEIRKKLRAFLVSYPDKVTFYAGENSIGNRGITQIKPIAKLPSMDNLLANKILDYCNNPRTKEKITGKFRNEGIDKVIIVIRSLEKSGILKTVLKGKFKCYQAES